jgi:transcriptional regulator with XRE-family HTH domain
MEFADRADLSHHTIGKIERREVFPTLETLLRLSEAHKIPMSEFFSDPAKATTSKEKSVRDLVAIVRRHDERKVEIALGLLKYLLPKL